MALNKVILYKKRIFFIIHQYYYGLSMLIYARIITMYMANIKLYKDKTKILEKDGICENNICKFDNIIYDSDNFVLTILTDDYRIIIDFKNINAKVELIGVSSLKLNLEVINMNIDKKIHKFVYVIESDEATNYLEIIL